jgi:hypothetical protein
MIEHLRYDYIKDQFEQMIKYLIEYASCEITVLRQSAIYGIGMTAVHCKDAFTPYLEKSIELLRIASDIEQGDQDREEHLHCKDNAISSIGKIIKQYDVGDDMNDLIVFWIEHMPIKIDLEESKIMNQLLSELLISKPNVLLGEDLHRLPPVLQLLGEQLHELYMEKETILSFGSILLDMQVLPMINEAFEVR